MTDVGCRPIHRKSIPEALRVASKYVNQNVDRAVASALREAMHNAAAYDAKDMVVLEHRREDQQMLVVFHDGRPFDSYDDIRTSLEYDCSGGVHGVQGSGMKFSAAALAPRDRFHQAATYVSSREVRDDEGRLQQGWTTFVGKPMSEQENDTLVIKEVSDFVGGIADRLPKEDAIRMRVMYAYPVTVPKLATRERILNWQVMAWLRAITSPTLQTPVRVRVGIKDTQDEKSQYHGQRIGTTGPRVYAHVDDAGDGGSFRHRQPVLERRRSDYRD